MAEIPNVNNLNGVSNFGHGTPSIASVPNGDIVVEDAASSTGYDILPDGGSPYTPELSNP